MKRKSGRPTKVPGQKLDVPLRVMLTRRQKGALKRAACGQDVSSWARGVLVRTALRSSKKFHQ